MLLHKPVFPGQNNDEQLRLIFNTLGIPSAADCPTLCSMPACMRRFSFFDIIRNLCNFRANFYGAKQKVYSTIIARRRLQKAARPLARSPSTNRRTGRRSSRKVSKSMQIEGPKNFQVITFVCLFCSTKEHHESAPTTRCIINSSTIFRLQYSHCQTLSRCSVCRASNMRMMRLAFVIVIMFDEAATTSMANRLKTFNKLELCLFLFFASKLPSTRRKRILSYTQKLAFKRKIIASIRSALCKFSFFTCVRFLPFS